MQDAVVLANCLYDLENLKHESIESALQDFREQRFHQVRIQIENSNVNAVLLNGQVIY